MIKLLFILLISGYTFSEVIPLQKITLLESSTSFDLYNPFQIVYNQKFYYGDSYVENNSGFMCRNICKYTIHIPESHSYIKAYRGLKLSALVMLLTGIGFTSYGIYQVTQRNEPQRSPPPLFAAGLILSVSSIIPNHISKFMIKPAVATYNEKIKSIGRY